MYRGSDGAMTCALCNCEMEWVECHGFDCEDGYYDGYEDDPLFYDRGDMVPCPECNGRGGSWWCVTKDCPTKRRLENDSSATTPKAMTEIELRSKALSDRLNQIKSELNERRLAECDKLLTEVGVPEWVMNSDSNGVPGNSVVCRLKWFLARRKNVAQWETDPALKREWPKWNAA